MRKVPIPPCFELWTTDDVISIGTHTLIQICGFRDVHFIGFVDLGHFNFREDSEIGKTTVLEYATQRVAKLT